MAWVAVDKNGEECICHDAPARDEYGEWMAEEGAMIPLPEGYIRRLIRQKLTWQSEPVKLRPIAWLSRPPRNRWRDIRDEAPRLGVTVLIVVERPKLLMLGRLNSVIRGHHLFDVGEKQIAIATHWMPIPRLPEER